ncbi:type II CAAX prenyl endopeptidase Rce1 family protein [Actinoplanes sp. NPDC051513]|uniref:CPBP family glutamic-type intramembrane protease n=1 Tax=Actinoplanes sp. NPDC051513 TaxID=3363908 RepID=UPI00378ECD97
MSTSTVALPRSGLPRPARYPVATLLVGTIAFTWITQAISLLAGWPVMPAKIGELLVLLGGATTITYWINGRPGVRNLFAGLVNWRLGAGRYTLLLLAMPLLTLGVAAATGTLQAPADGWLSVALTYLIYLVFGALTANVWEETVWAGFVQQRLMTRRGLLTGSLLTAVPFFLIHLPLAFETQGWQGTTWTDAAATWAVLLAAAPFMRYLIGTLLIDTRGSTLAAGLLHASFNAAGALAVLQIGWQGVPALALLTAGVVAYRSRHGLSATHGVPAPDSPVEPSVQPVHTMTAAAPATDNPTPLSLPSLKTGN